MSTSHEKDTVEADAPTEKNEIVTDTLIDSDEQAGILDRVACPVAYDMNIHQPIDPYPPKRHSVLRSTDVHSPISGSVFLTIFLFSIPLLIIVILCLPWQQSAMGDGEITSYAPTLRPQKIDAPIDGVIVEWMVSEGQSVSAGDVLVKLENNDPERLNRLSESVSLGEEQIENIEQKYQLYQNKLQAEKDALAQKLAETENKLQALQEKRIGADSELQTEELQLQRYLELLQDGIVSQRNLDVARVKRDKALATRDALLAEIDGMNNTVQKTQLEGNAKLAEIEGEITEISVKLASSRQKQLELQSKLVQQSTQNITASTDGVVYKLSGGIQGEQVKKGKNLLSFVPHSTDRIVALYIDGNDVSLTHIHQEVRLVFEGWPAIQFVGFPGLDAGTFVGRIKIIEPTMDEKGKFRIWVEQMSPEHPWPSAELLRQGLRVKGWVLLGSVPLGYELWRKINGFPIAPTVDKGEKPILPSSKKNKNTLDNK